MQESADLHDPAIKKVWLATRELEDQAQWKKIATIESTTQRTLQQSEISGLTKAAYKPENAAVVKNIPVQAYDKTYTQEEFQLSLPFSKHMWMFGIENRDLTNLPTKLRVACVNRLEQLFAERLDNGWDTTYSQDSGAGSTRTVTISAADGVAVFSASHTRPDGGSNWNNIVYDDATYNMDFDEDSLEALQQVAAATPDHVGEKFRVNPDTIIFKKGSPISFKAQRFERAKGRPETAENDGKSDALTFTRIEMDYLENSAYYYAFDSSLKNSEYGFQYKESQPIMMEGPETNFTTDQITYKAGFIGAIGVMNPRGWIASKGTNA